MEPKKEGEYKERVDYICNSYKTSDYGEDPRRVFDSYSE